MLAAVIFDVDGTLLDTERLYIQAWKQAGALLGYPMTDALMYSTRGRDGQTVQRLMAEALGEDFPYDEVRKLRVSLAEEAISREKNLCKPGAMELLTELSRLGIPFAAATTTDKDLTAAHLEAAGLARLVTHRVTGDMVEHSKPAPDIYLKAAALLGVAPGECLAVEDSLTGLAAATAAGMQTVWIPDLHSNPCPGQAHCSRRYESLTQLLKDLPQWI